jgi:hypothetical protein
MKIQVNTYDVNILNCTSPNPYIMLFGVETTTKDSYRVRMDFTALTENNTYALTVSADLVMVPMNFKLFGSVVDLLRNEMPIYFTWSTQTKIGILSTAAEAVGGGSI